LLRVSPTLLEVIRSASDALLPAGYNKLDVIRPYVTEDNVEEWVNKAASLSRSDLRTEIAEAFRSPPAINGPDNAGQVKLYKGDMLTVLAMLDQRFDLVVADPPYGVTGYEWDKLDTENWLRAVIPCLKDEYHLFWFCSPRHAADIELIFREVGLEIQSRIVWHRRNMAMGSHAKNKFIDSWEMILHVGNKMLNFPPEWSDAWFDVQIHAVPQTNFGDQKLHPTQKPLSLIRRLVEFGSAPGDIVLDPFAGAGTTGAACQLEDARQCVLIERDGGYCRIIEGRLGVIRNGK